MPLKVCSIPDCGKRVIARGWCTMHYCRWQRKGDPGEAGSVRTPRGVSCYVEDCGKPVIAKGLCGMHYERQRQHGDVAKVIGHYERWDGRRIVECRVDGCDKPHLAVGLCTSHYQRLRKYGDPLVELQHTGGYGPRVGVRAELVNYGAAHRRVASDKGPASSHLCVDRCSFQAEQWAYDHCDPDELVDEKLGIPYSLKSDHYVPRCRPCHTRFDVYDNRPWPSVFDVAAYAPWGTSGWLDG